MFRIQFKISLIFSLFLLLCCNQVFGQYMFLIGEDIAGPNGIVMSVNNLERKLLTSGLGGMAKNDEIIVNLTLVNTGHQTIRVNPVENFSIELRHKFEASESLGDKKTTKAFNLFPAAQSRIDLFFKVPSAEKVEPILIFAIGESSVQVLCDTDLQKLAARGAKSGLTTEESAKLGRFYLDAGRYAKAEEVVAPALDRDPYNYKLLVQMASIWESKGKRIKATDCLSRINSASVTTFDDAISLAKQSYKLGFYNLAISVLDPYQLTNRLNDEQLVLLGRCYYYNRDYNKAENTISSVIRNSTSDKLAYFTMGNIKNKLNKLDEAIDMWEKAIELDPEYCEAYYNLGVGYYKKKNILKAREYWSKVPLLHPDSDTLEAVEEALKSTEQ